MKEKESNLCRNPIWPPLIVTYAFSFAAVILVHVKLPAAISDDPSLVTRTDSCVHPAPHNIPPVLALLPEPVATLQVIVGTRVTRRHTKVELAHLPCNNTTAIIIIIIIFIYKEPYIQKNKFCSEAHTYNICNI